MIDEPKALRWLHRFLPRTRSKAIFLFVTYCYSVALTHIAARLITAAGFWQIRVDPENNIQQYVRPGVDDSRLIDLLVISPLVESLVTIVIIESLHRLKFRTVVQVIVSTSVICFLHGIEYAFWAFSIAPEVAIEAGTYIYWRRISVSVGAAMIVALHVLFNCLPALTVIMERLNG